MSSHKKDIKKQRCSETQVKTESEFDVSCQPANAS